MSKINKHGESDSPLNKLFIDVAIIAPHNKLHNHLIESALSDVVTSLIQLKGTVDENQYISDCIAEFLYNTIRAYTIGACSAEFTVDALSWAAASIKKI